MKKGYKNGGRGEDQTMNGVAVCRSSGSSVQRKCRRRDHRGHGCMLLGSLSYINALSRSSIRRRPSRCGHCGNRLRRSSCSPAVALAAAWEQRGVEMKDREQVAIHSTAPESPLLQ